MSQPQCFRVEVGNGGEFGQHRLVGMHFRDLRGTLHWLHHHHVVPPALRDPAPSKLLVGLTEPPSVHLLSPLSKLCCHFLAIHSWTKSSTTQLSPVVTHQRRGLRQECKCFVSASGVLHELLSATCREEPLEHPKSANYVYYHTTQTCLHLK